MRRLLYSALALSLLSPALALAQQPHQPEGRSPGHGPSSNDQNRHGDYGHPANGHGANGHTDNGHSAEGRGDNHGPHPAMHQAHNWGRGERFDGHRYVLDWRRHHLHQPPPGYEWVNVGGQYMMIAIASGVIAEVLMAPH